MDKFNFIKENVSIDFPIPQKLRSLLDEAEELDRKRNVEYFGVADTIDVLCKGYVRQGKITHEQWDIICYKYSVNGKIESKEEDVDEQYTGVRSVKL